MTVCCQLMDLYLVEGVRLPGPGYAPHTNTAYYCTCSVKDARGCLFEEHPQHRNFMVAMCEQCRADLGNVQVTSMCMEGDWSIQLGEMAMCFKCQNVYLELPDCHEELLDVKKWSLLYSALGGGDCRMSTVTMQMVAPKLRSALSSNVVSDNSNRTMRLVPRSRPGGRSASPHT